MKPKAFPPNEQPLVAHLVELRDRLLRAVLTVLIIFLALISFSNELYSWLAQPLLSHLPEGTSMIATEVASPFFTPFKLTMVVSVFAAMPFILYQMWSFIAPGLYDQERRLAWPLMASSTLLFYAGAAFAYFVVFPIVFGFFTSVAPDGVAVMTDIAKYLDFVLKMFFAFGLAFEVPIATILLVRTGIASRASLAAKRPYIIVAAFVLGMLLTPPDVLSQSLLALPMLILFELGLFFSKIFEPSKVEDDEGQEEDEPHPADQAAAATAGDDDYIMTDEEMEAEFDRLEEEEKALNDEPDSGKDKA